MKDLLKKPSGWLPIGMSVVALFLILSYVAIFGVRQPQTDEGLAARIFQFLLVGQVPIVGYFAIRWYPKHPKQVLQVVIMQILAALIPFLTVLFLEI